MLAKSLWSFLENHERGQPFLFLGNSEAQPAKAGRNYIEQQGNISTDNFGMI